MFRMLTAIAACATVAAPALAKDYTDVQAEFVYDISALETESGAEAVLNDIEAQARDACKYVSMTSMGIQRDQVCVRDLVRQAIDKIGAETLTVAYTDSPLFVERVSDRLQLAQK